MRVVRSVGPLLVALVAATLTFVLIEVFSLGWIAFGAKLPRVVVAGEIDAEALKLGTRLGMLNAWVHNIKPGQEVGFHEHPTRAEMVVVIRGTARVRGLRKGPEGQPPIIREEVLGEGSMIFSPASSVHEYANMTNEPLYCFVIMSPPVRGNVYLDGEPPQSAKDFLVVPLMEDGSARGDFVPSWASNREAPWRGDINYFPGIAARVHRNARELRGAHFGSESWVLLVSGLGTLKTELLVEHVTGPSWIEAPSGRWSITSNADELVAIEFSLPGFDARLFTLAMVERYLSDGLQAWVPGMQALRARHSWGHPDETR